MCSFQLSRLVQPCDTWNLGDGIFHMHNNFKSVEKHTEYNTIEEKNLVVITLHLFVTLEMPWRGEEMR